MRSQVVAGGNNWQTTITGVAPTYTFIRNWSIVSGQFFSQNDVYSANKVAVLGQTVVQNLFPDGSSPIGQTIIAKGVPFTVVGTLKAMGMTDAFDAGKADFSGMTDKDLGAMYDYLQTVPPIKNEVNAFPDRI